jgi:hypothetical protein
MKYLISSLLAAVMMAIASIIVPAAKAAVTTNIIVPIQSVTNGPQFVPCANNGQGENVLLTGNLHFLFLTTTDNNGGVLGKFQFQRMGVIGTGQTTGDIWHGTGSSQVVACFLLLR